jgi:pyruvate,water dikinase
MRVAQRELVAQAAKRREPEPAERGPELAGIGASPGLGVGRARVLRGPVPSELDPGEVVVVPHADPAASPLYLRAAALVVETGGLLTPAAGVARELALPAVMSVARATTTLRDGELVRVDGTRGSVERLESP